MYEIVEEKSCDLVVLGGGGSGMVAAVRAAQLSGKKVIVLEKVSVTGGGCITYALPCVPSAANGRQNAICLIQPQSMPAI